MPWRRVNTSSIFSSSASLRSCSSSYRLMNAFLAWYGLLNTAQMSGTHSRLFFNAALCTSNRSVNGLNAILMDPLR